MDRRDFLKMSSMTALLTAGDWTGLSKVFAQSASQSKNGYSNGNNPSGNMEYRNLGSWLEEIGANREETESPGETSMKVKISVGNRTITATMEDNAAGRDFLSRLPLEVTLNDYNNTTEKIFYPDSALTTEGVARGCAPTPGDITIYVPWGNVAIFCKSWSHSDDLIKIGRIDGNGIEALNIGGDITVKFERQ